MVEKEDKISLMKKLKERKFIMYFVGFVSLVLIVALYALLKNEVCFESQVIYDSQVVPMQICMPKNVAYSEGGVIKNIEFTVDFIKTLVVSVGSG